MKISNKITPLVILLSAILLFHYSCEPREKRIKVYNNTDSTIYVYWSATDSITNKDSLNLFCISHDNNEIITIYNRRSIISVNSPVYRLNPYSWGKIEERGQEEILDKCIDNKIRIFYIKEDIMQNKTWNEIVQKQLYIRKEIFSKKDLEPYSWTIEYNK